MLEAVFDAIPWPAFVADDRGRIVAANAATARLGVADPAALTCRDVARVLETAGWRRTDGMSPIPPEWLSRAIGDTSDVETLVHVDAGEIERRLEVTRTRIPAPDGAVYQLICCRDTTGRRRAPRRERAGDDRYRLLFEHTLDGIMLTTPAGDITGANPAMCALLGRSEDELRRLGRAGAFVQDEALARALDERTRTGRVRAELTFIRKDGTTFTGDTSSVVVNGQDPESFVIVRDVTSRKRTEEALHDSERRFKGLIEAASEAIFVQTNGRFAYVNDATLRLFGAARSEQLLDTPVLERFVPAHRDSVAARIRELNNARRAVPLVEEMGLRLDATQVSLEVSASPIVYDGQQGAVVFARDVTERKRLESQLMQAQRLESVGRLAGGVAHDFNNMLGVIMGYAELRLSMTPATDPARNDLEEILAAARKSAALTRQLLAFARKQTIRPQPLDLNDSVANTLKMLERLVGEDITVAWRPAASIWLVNLDPSQVDQILANLVVNARDAMPRGGRISMETTNDVLDEGFQARHPGVAAGEYVRLTVSDNGTGMAPSVVRQVFEPFFTTKPAGEGTGLGLATVYGIVKQHGGFIDVYSEPGLGTTFRLWFPRYVEDAERVQGPQLADTLPQGTETVLLVEDEDSILRLGRTMLTMLGYRVLTASNAFEAIETAAAHPAEIDLLVSDVVMPGLNGRELAARLQADRPGMKCLFMSGYTADVIAHHGVLDQGVNLVQKPFSLLALAKGVREALDGR